MDAPKLTRQRARELRENLTPPEGVRWSKLRSHRLKGLKFRRQHPMGPYITDFYCHEARLIIELDGPTHGPRREHDARRDAYFQGEGVETLRFPASDTPKHMDRVLGIIHRRAMERMGKVVDGPSPGGSAADFSQGER